MPDDFFDILDAGQSQEDLLEPTESRFYECAACALQPGSPVLCADCFDRRSQFINTGRTRRPFVRLLRTETEQRQYLTYLNHARDDQEYREPSFWTDDDLDRAFPGRHEDLLEAWTRRPSNPPSMQLLGPTRTALQDLLSLEQESELLTQEIYQTLNVPREMLVRNLVQTLLNVEERHQENIAQSRASAKSADFKLPRYDTHFRPEAEPTKEKPVQTSRFEREVAIEEKLYPSQNYSPSRQSKSKLAPEILAYLRSNNGWGSRSARAAWEKLFGEIESFELSSRFERIIWDE